ncbi:MAG: penicillin-binding protein [Bacteroidetes bacterium]|nr:MAG: penicillin-binding protein [Bacteroidota bacterium]
MKKSVRIFWRVFIGGFLAFVVLVIMCAYGVFGEMPSLKELENPSLLQTSEVYAVDGTLMGKYYLERGNRSNVEYSDLSKHLIDALIATEDERFYSHSGIDFKRTISAVVSLGSRGGASTITQQLAKALLEHQKGSKANRVIQKLKEWIIAIKLERNFTKEEIVALYLNAVPYGDNIYGIRNATRTFFQKEPYAVNINESAMLIGMLKGNSLYNPRRNAKAAFDRRNVVLNQMVKNGKISEAEAAKLKVLPNDISKYKKMDENTGYAPYFREILREELKEILKDTKNPDGKPYNIYDDGLRIYTTINPRMQEYAEEAVYSHMPVMQKILNSTSYIKNGSIWKEKEKILEDAMKSSDRWKNLDDDGLSEKEIRASFSQKVPMKIFAWNAKREKDTVMTPMDSIKYHKQMLQASFMVMDPVTGEVKAWVGGISFKTYKYDHVNLKTKRQIGSTVKPFLYAQAVEERGMNAETILERTAVHFPGGWVPSQKNCKGGTMSFAAALAWSDNCCSAHVMEQVGPGPFADFLGRIGIPTKVEPYPSNALGACDLSLFELMWGYSIFAGRGFTTKPYFITRIEDRNGNTIKRFDYSVNRKEAISEVTAYKMTQLMQGTVDVGTAAGLRNRLGAAAMGGKTGTTNDNTDAWFMGYVPQLEAGGWVGCDDRFIHLAKSDTRGYGGFAARPIWEYFMKKVYADNTLGLDRSAVFAKPENMDNEILSADPLATISELPPPGAEGTDIGAGSSQDYNNTEYIGPESQKVPDEDAPIKKDTLKYPAKKDDSDIKPIGAPTEDKKKKKGLLKRIFDKKDN